METNNEELKDEEMINPSDIIFTEEDDMDMPEPETNDYDNKEADDPNSSKLLTPTYKFMEMFHDCLGKMPYSSVLKNNADNQIKLVDLIRFVEAKHEQMSVKDMNTIISFIANCPFEHVRPLMEIIEDTKRQVELWTLL